MGRFLKHITATLLLAALVMEVLLRIFHLSGHVLPEASVNGDRMLKPGIEGHWSSGGLREFRGHYRVNAQGWNSVVDYDRVDTGKISVAIIGDSYVEGLHFDVENSVGRILESISPRYQVHEYGKSGANLVDYAMISEKWTSGNYDHVFVLLSDDDLVASRPNFMGLGDEFTGPSKLRKIYYNCHLARYLGLNHGLGVRIRELLARMGAGPGEAPDADFLQQINLDALERLDPNVVYLCQQGRLNTVFITKYNCLVIDHRLQPYDCGFAGHWNMNGRYNTAHTLDWYIKSHQQ